MKTKVLALIEALEKDNPGAEAVSLYQNGETLLTHRFVPYKERQIYSHTKSFVATLAGIAIDEGKLSLDQKIAELFPEYEHVVTDSEVKNITLEHLLTMSSGFGGSFLMGAKRRNGEGMPDYMAYMLSKPLKYRSGTKFCYSNADTHLVSRAVEKAVGEPLQKYAYRKLFSPLGIGMPNWATDPDGVPFGGSGLYLDIEDMMKLGILYLNGGKWQEEQIVSSDWVKQASSAHISTGYGGEWSNSYGYQFWIVDSREGVYRADGAYGQYSIVFPEENAVLSTQCSEYNNTEKFALMLREYVVDNI